MNASVVIVCHNEERDLEATIALVWASDPPAHEIIVVDDCSDVPVAPRLSSFGGVKVIRPPQQLGAGPAKRLGGNTATGDVVVIMDSHMRVPMDWLAVVTQAVEMYPRSIFCAACSSFETTSKFSAAGAELTRADDIFLGRRWLPRGDEKVIDRCPCVLGACYVVPRVVWDTLDGINPNLSGWGYGEQDLSLRSWMCGFEVRRINGLLVRHRFNRKLKGGNKLNTWHNSYNALVTAATVFEEGVFEQVYEPFMRKLFSQQAFDCFESNELQIEAFRQFVQKVRVYSDDELYGLCDLRVPTVDEQQQKTTAILENRKRTRKPKKPLRVVGKTPKLTIGEAHLRRIIGALPENGRMLEWGCGSTMWLRNHLLPGQELVSIEHDAKRAERVGGVMLHPMSARPGSEAEQLPGENTVCLDVTLPYTAAGGLGQFDVVLVDGILRNACLLSAVDLLKPDGTIFLHDGERDWYRIGKTNWRWKAVAATSDLKGPHLWVGHHLPVVGDKSAEACKPRFSRFEGATA